MDEIEDLKAKAQTGTAIVEALVENSETFERKTEFAQEKYLSRKAKKYCTTISALRPTVATISETQFDWSEVKIGFLRVDTLSIMLSLANVGAYRRVLVVDNCMGLLAAAVEERMGGMGDICVGFFGKKPCRLESLSRFKSPPSNVFKIPLVSLAELRRRSDLGEDLKGDDLVADLSKRSGAGQEKIVGWLRKGFDSCLLADWKVHPSALVEAVLPLLAPSASFAVYSSGATSLVECQDMLMKRDDVVMVELQDLWWREFQV